MPEYKFSGFDDIRKGDKLRVIYDHGDVVTERTGVAHRCIGDGLWVTQSNIVLARKETLASVELLLRPESVNPFEEAGVGSVATKNAFIYIKEEAGWRAYSTDGKFRNHRTYNDAEMFTGHVELTLVVGKT